MKRLLVLTALLAGSAMAQQTDDGDKLVTVPKRYVSNEALAHQTDPSVSKWIGVGREIGQATREGLSAVVDQAERFGSTKVGTFIMAMVAWRIVGHDILRVALGVPLWIAGICLWVWSYRRFHAGYRVLLKKDGKVKEWQSKSYAFKGDDARTASAIAHVIALAAWCGCWIPMVFA